MRADMLIAVAPAVLLLWLFERWDAKRPEPSGSVRNVVLLGVATCLPAAIIELLLANVVGKAVVDAQGGVFKAFVIAAMTEETLKLSVILLYLWKKPHFEEVVDGILYTAAASLGFAVLENILYSAGNPAVGILRAFTAVPMPAACSGIMGYFIGRGRLSRGHAVPWVIGGLGVAIFIHGLYDWAVFSGGTFGFAKPVPLLSLLELLPIVLISGLVLRLLVRDAQRRDDGHHGIHARPLQRSGSGQVPVLQYSGHAQAAHSSASRLAAAEPSFAPGTRAMVAWSDGNRYPATVISGARRALPLRDEQRPTAVVSGPVRLGSVGFIMMTRVWLYGLLFPEVT